MKQDQNISRQTLNTSIEENRGKCLFHLYFYIIVYHRRKLEGSYADAMERNCLLAYSQGFAPTVFLCIPGSPVTGWAPPTMGTTVLMAKISISHKILIMFHLYGTRTRHFLLSILYITQHGHLLNTCILSDILNNEEEML